MTTGNFTQNLVLLDTVIRRDEAGRFCVNDLHRAAGGEKRHQPSDWLRMEQTQALVAEVEIPGIPGIVSKQGLGTYVCKELVYSYAMWISPSFHLKVIRAYDEMVTSSVPSFTHARALTVNEAACDMMKTHLSVWELLKVPEHIRQQEVVKQVRYETGVDFSPALKFAPAQLSVDPKEMMLEPTELAKSLGFSSAIAVNKWLQKIEMQTKTKAGWEPTEKGKQICVVHSWMKGNKQGYNLRWNVKALKELRETATA